MAPRPRPPTPDPTEKVLANAPIWVVGALGAGIPVLLGTMHALWQARGDFFLAVEILRATDPISFLAVGILLTISTGFAAIMIASYRVVASRRFGSGAEAKIPDGMYYTVTGILLVAGIFVTNTAVVLVLLAVYLVRLDYMVRVYRSLSLDQRKQMTKDAAGRRIDTILVTIFGAASAVLVAVTPWPPPEVVQVDNEPPRWAFVLFVDDKSTTVVYPEGGLEHIDNGKQIARALCPDIRMNGTAPWHPSLLRLILRNHNEVRPALCAVAPSPPRFGL